MAAVAAAAVEAAAAGRLPEPAAAAKAVVEAHPKHIHREAVVDVIQREIGVIVANGRAVAAVQAKVELVPLPRFT